MEADLQLIKDCGFNSFEEVVKKINELVDVMRAARLRAEKYLERFTNEAKKFLKEGQKDKAKREILKRKSHAERVKTIDGQLNIILEKLKEVKNSSQMLQVLKATKYCNNLLLSELGQKDMKEDNNNETNENQDLLDNDKEISKYLEILANFKKKKAKPATQPIEQKEENIEDTTNNFPQPENNNFPQDNNISSNAPQDSGNTNANINNTNNNNLGINQKKEEENKSSQAKINNQNLNNNININQNYNNIQNNNQNNNFSKSNQNYNIPHNNQNYNNQFNNNQFNNNYNNVPNNNQYNNMNPNNNNFNNNFSNNNYNFNNYSKKNPYDDIF